MATGKASTPTRGRASGVVHMGNASTYNGFYLRDNLASDGQVPALAPYNQCPDIIQSSTTVSDPERTFSTPPSWDEIYQTAPVPGENYYYVRGLNGSQETFCGELSLFCIPAELLLFPALWENSRLQTASGSETVPGVHAAPGHIGVGTEPFVLHWPARGRAFSAATFTSFIAQNTAQPIPTINSWIQLSQMMTQQLNFGWRNTVTFDPMVDEGRMLHQMGLTIPGTVSTPGQIQLILTMYGFIGDTVSLIADRYTPEQKPIQILPTRVTQDGQSLGFAVTLDPGFAGHLTVQYWNTSAKVPAAGSTITLSANYIVPREQRESAVAAGVLDSQYSAAIARSLLGASSARRRSGVAAAQHGVTPQPVAPVGAATFIATPSARDTE